MGMLTRDVARTDAPAAVGPYTQAVRVGELLFLSGSLGLDPAAMKLVSPLSRAYVEDAANHSALCLRLDMQVGGGVEAQARQALKNMKAVIEAGGSELGKVIKTTVFLADMNDFKAVNAIYSEFFGEHKPARSAVQVARLPLDALFEIEAIVSAA
ncbi:translation initiation inhibitor [Lenzites betulinus]|nr:translation initiation inhibitor [Lenzites betulinus]